MASAFKVASQRSPSGTQDSFRLQSCIPEKRSLVRKIASAAFKVVSQRSGLWYARWHPPSKLHPREAPLERKIASAFKVASQRNVLWYAR